MKRSSGTIKDKSLWGLQVVVTYSTRGSDINISSNGKMLYEGSREDLLETIYTVQVGNGIHVPHRLRTYIQNENFRRFIYATAYLQELIKT